MNILSCFDGMSCGQIALNRLGFKVDNYFASEIDKYAIQVAQYNYPETVQLGDINNWQEWDLPEVDLLMGGSPCQGFSNSGKGLNFDDPRSKLFFVFEDILKAKKPKYWLLENVNMKQEWQDIISQRLGIKPLLINSALVSAQNRERLYWTNIYNKSDLFGYPYCAIPQPEDKKIYLKDIIESGEVDRHKDLCLVKSYNKTSKSESALDRYFRKGSGQIVFDYPVLAGRLNNSQNGKVADVNGKSFTLPLKDRPKIIQRSRGNNKGGLKAEDGKVPTLTGSNWQNNNKLLYTKNYVQFDVSGKGHKLQQDRAYYPYSKSPTLSKSNERGDKANILLDELHYRKLTPLECERLQTVPDSFTLVLDDNGKQLVSNSQRYKMLGNGWTVDVICHILSFM